MICSFLCDISRSFPENCHSLSYLNQSGCLSITRINVIIFSLLCKQYSRYLSWQLNGRKCFLKWIKTRMVVSRVRHIIMVWLIETTQCERLKHILPHALLYTHTFLVNNALYHLNKWVYVFYHSLHFSLYNDIINSVTIIEKPWRCVKQNAFHVRFVTMASIDWLPFSSPYH